MVKTENTTQQPRVVLLYRASSKQQTSTDANDIPLQRNILKPWAEQKGYIFVREFVEAAVSGFKVSAAKRDAIIEIKAMAERAEFDVLGIYMSDRLGRIAEETPLIISFLNARGIKVESYCEGEINSSTHADKLMTYIRYWQAEGESIKTSARVCDAVLENVNKGRWRGGSAPYGYRSVSRGTLNYKGKPILDVEIDPITGEHVKTMFRLYTEEHYGTRMVARYLNDNGIPTPRGTLWNSSLVCKVLRCKTYLGIYELHKNTKHKPLVASPVMEHMVLVDEAVWHKAQELLVKNSTGPRRPPTRHGELLLTGLLYCGQCGTKLRSFYSYASSERHKPSEERVKRYYYRCCKDEKPKSNMKKCKPSMWSVDIMDERVIYHAKKFITTLDREKLLSDHTNETQSKIEDAIRRQNKAESDLDKNEKEIKKLKDEIMRALLGESTFPQSTLSEMLAAKETERLGLFAKHESAQEYIYKLESELNIQKDFVHEFDDWECKFDRASTGDKKSMLLNIIDRIDVHGDEVSVIFKVQLSPIRNKNDLDNIIPIEFTDGDSAAEYSEISTTSNKNAKSYEITPATDNFLYPSAVKRCEYAPMTKSS